MTFDNKLIVDATMKGNMTRFVNHSCDPNCEMIKMMVKGRPRMALFAGAEGIVTGEELTYDYNFEYVFLSLCLPMHLADHLRQSILRHLEPTMPVRCCDM